MIISSFYEDNGENEDRGIFKVVFITFDGLM
jgi:hypothetical protein